MVKVTTEGVCKHKTTQQKQIQHKKTKLNKRVKKQVSDIEMFENEHKKRLNSKSAPQSQ